MPTHRFLSPRDDEKGPGGRHVFDCLTCDGTMSPSPTFSPAANNTRGGGWWWRDAPDAEWRIWRTGAPCPNTRDRAAEKRKKMIDEFRAATRTGPWDAQ